MKFDSRKKSHKMTCLLVAAALAGACAKKKDDEDDDADTTETGGAPVAGGVVPEEGSIATSNILALAYPDSLAIAAFPRTGGAALTQDETKEKSVKEKVDANEAILKGEAAKCLDTGLFGTAAAAPAEVTCYEFDSDMNPSQFAGEERTYGTLDGTDGKGEACMVAFAREQVKDSVATVDRALALVAGMMCQAKKDGAVTGLPATGESLDFKASLEGATGGALTVTEAGMTRLADIDGQAVFRSDISVTDPKGRAFQVHLVHSPGANDTYKGTLSVTMAGGGDKSSSMEQDPNNSANKNDAMSINYQRIIEDGTARVRYEVRRAQIVNTIEPFDANGLVNYAALPDDAQNDQVHAISYVAFDMNPETNEGDMSYWMNPGGNVDESARGFLFNIKADAEGVLAGCGVSGSTDQVSIRKAVTSSSEANVLSPVQYWHPREDANIHPDKDERFDGNFGDFVTKQCFKQNSEGLYAVDTSVTKHERGYDVVPHEDSKVVPPDRPEAKLEGDILAD